MSFKLETWGNWTLNSSTLSPGNLTAIFWGDPSVKIRDAQVPSRKCPLHSPPYHHNADWPGLERSKTLRVSIRSSVISKRKWRFHQAWFAEKISHWARWFSDENLHVLGHVPYISHGFFQWFSHKTLHFWWGFPFSAGIWGPAPVASSDVRWRILGSALNPCTYHIEYIIESTYPLNSGQFVW